MQILYILLAIFMLGFIVTVHEFGHYIVGRLCGIGIVEFSIGMGPKLLGFKKKDIQYSLRLIPIGGFCAFVGEDEENPAPNAMNNQPVWKRFLTVLAGPAMNFVLAFLFCAILLSSFIVADYQPRIVNVGSISAYTSSTARGEYCISKAGVGMVTQLFADRLAAVGIPVFEVRPGIIATDMTSTVHEKYEKLIAEGLLPIPRFGQPQDVAKMVCACASGLLDYSAGQVLNADGGFALRRL